GEDAAIRHRNVPVAEVEKLEKQHFDEINKASELRASPLFRPACTRRRSSTLCSLALVTLAIAV
ncbi:hypothetical protein Q6249_28730, partial [Klebsiella pneumoniae]